MSAKLQPAYVFDAAATLGIGTPSSSPLPCPVPGTIVLRVPEGVSLRALRDTEVGRSLMLQQEWYLSHEWSRQPSPAGTYLLRLPIPGSGGRTPREQLAMLPAGEELASVTLAAAAVLSSLLEGLPIPNLGFWVWCAESGGRGNVAMTFGDDRLVITDVFSNTAMPYIFASSAERIRQ